MLKNRVGIRAWQAFIKRTFDLAGSIIGLILTGWLIALAYVVSTIDTGKSGFFVQKRVGIYGRIFKLIKIRTMRERNDIKTNVTTRSDPRITKLGAFIRRYKIDELPQLINILLGHMSFVGPRPDVPGFADKLIGNDRVILSVRPGITGPATLKYRDLKYRDEEEILASKENPEEYNQKVIFPEKVRINKKYVENYHLRDDFYYIWYTIFGKKVRRK